MTVLSLRARASRKAWSVGNLGTPVCVLVILGALFVAIFGSLLAPHDSNSSDLSLAFVGSEGSHLLGYDGQGRDIFSRLLVGTRTSMAGPIFVVLLAVACGAILAVIAAMARGWVDSFISTVLDILFAFPAILLAVLAAAIFGPGLASSTLALAIAYTPYIARVLRSVAIREAASDYVAACRVQGLSTLSIGARHLIPNIAPMIVAQSTLIFGYAMADFAAISFLGLGIQPPNADWGVMISNGQSGVLQGYPTESLAAGACIVVVVVALNLLGERLIRRQQEAR